MKEAYLYSKIDKLKVKCNLCMHNCIISEDNKGKCFARINKNGTLFSMIYDKLIAENVDPIEKKPLFHFFPGSYSYSIAAPGCNFQCFFCQNFEISQLDNTDKILNSSHYASPESIVRNAVTYGCKSIAYTYTEPTVYFELSYDTAVIAKKNNIANVFVTNGFMSKEAIDMINPYLDAANIDLKSFSNDFYRKYLKARLTPVLENIEYVFKLGIWLEVTTLLIPGLNDSDREIEGIADFISSISKYIPWHVSAYYPNYKSNIAPTDSETVFNAVKIGKDAGLRYVYAGNILNNSFEDTYCSSCGKLLIKRSGYNIISNHLKNNICPKCSYPLHGFF